MSKRIKVKNMPYPKQCPASVAGTCGGMMRNQLKNYKKPAK
jgi:hypothetical protein